MRQRVEVGKKWLAGEVAPAWRMARALLLSRQSLYKPRQVRKPLIRPVPRPVVRELASDVKVSPEMMTVEDALVVLARRHVA